MMLHTYNSPKLNLIFSLFILVKVFILRLDEINLKLF